LAQQRLIVRFDRAVAFADGVLHRFEIGDLNLAPCVSDHPGLLKGPRVQSDAGAPDAEHLGKEFLCELQAVAVGQVSLRARSVPRKPQIQLPAAPFSCPNQRFGSRFFLERLYLGLDRRGSLRMPALSVVQRRLRLVDGALPKFALLLPGSWLYRLATLALPFVRLRCLPIRRALSGRAGGFFVFAAGLWTAFSVHPGQGSSAVRRVRRRALRIPRDA
jgi:hypothetical protein